MKTSVRTEDIVVHRPVCIFCEPVFGLIGSVFGHVSEMHAFT